MAGDVALVFETTAPLLFRATDPGSTAPNKAAWLANNLRVFQACDVLDERAPADRGEVDPVVALELRRLDLKMTLMLELMGELLAATTGSGPQRVDIELDFRGVKWSPADQSLMVGSRGTLDLYIHPNIPRPLKFAGTITRLEPENQSARFDFDPLTEVEGDQLERLIFRHHRRKVADARGMKRPI